MSMRKCEICNCILTEPGELCEHEMEDIIKSKHTPKFSHQEAMDIAARVDARHAGQDERYPQSEKLRRGHVERHTISEFLEWIEDQGMGIQNCPDTTYEDLLMRYLDIDTAALETERRTMLNELRKAQANERENTTEATTRNDVQT